MSFTAFGVDPDNDQVTLQAVGRGFTLSQANMSFSTVSGTGKVSQVFSWTPSCTDAQRANHLVDFIITDNRCNRNLRDTVTVDLNAIGLPSRPPTVRTSLKQPVIDIVVNPSDTTGIVFDVLADDPEHDTLRLTGQGAGFSMQALGMSFTNKRGTPTLQSAFTWRPTCDLLIGRDEAVYVLNFVADDGSCQPRHTDTTSVTVRLKNISSDFKLTVPNVFTPNGDGFNDFFEVRNMPVDNCNEQFRYVEIANRWGKVVYRSVDRNFRWSGDDNPAGTYYYTIQFTRQSVKGPLTLLRR